MILCEMQKSGSYLIVISVISHRIFAITTGSMSNEFQKSIEKIVRLTLYIPLRIQTQNPNLLQDRMDSNVPFSIGYVSEYS